MSAAGATRQTATSSMPSKVKFSVSPEKNRESQRRSRARRKELINSLSREVAQYKSQGVAASMAMQNAARAVSAENKRLRELLALRGVSEVEISTYLASSRQGASALVPISISAQKATPTAGDLSGRNRTDGDANVTRKAVELKPPNTTDSNQSRTSIPLPNATWSQLTNKDKLEHSAEKVQSAALTISRTLSPRGTRRSHNEAGSHHQSDEELYAQSWQGEHEDGNQRIYSGYSLADYGILPPVSDVFGVQEPLAIEIPNSLETSCDTAAEILVQLHRKTDSVETRAALGCVGTASCSVKNTTIFKLMDELS